MAGLAGLGVKDFQWMPVSDVKTLARGSDVLNCPAHAQTCPDPRSTGCKYQK
jgi:hypothetical protein